jgi:hypothetical protein
MNFRGEYSVGNTSLTREHHKTSEEFSM